jgi:hypothetical protein
MANRSLRIVDREFYQKKLKKPVNSLLFKLIISVIFEFILLDR